MESNNQKERLPIFAVRVEPRVRREVRIVAATKDISIQSAVDLLLRKGLAAEGRQVAAH